MQSARVASLIMAVAAAFVVATLSFTGTASAKSVYCSASPEQKPFPNENETRCIAGTSLKSGTRVLTSGDLEINTPVGKFSCSLVTSLGTFETTNSNELQQTKLTVNSLDLGVGVKCSTTMECKEAGSFNAATPWEETIEWESKTAPQGSATIQEPEMVFQLNDCSIFQIDVTCVYAGNAGEKVKGTITNPEGVTPMQANFNKAPIKEGPTKSGLCPDEGNLTMNFKGVQVENAKKQKDQTNYNGQVWLAAQQHPNDKP
jgi:hypothetical protein